MDRAGYLPHGHAHVIVDAPRMTHDTPRAPPLECRAQRGEMLSKTPLAFEARLSPGGLASWAVPALDDDDELSLVDDDDNHDEQAGMIVVDKDWTSEIVRESSRQQRRRLGRQSCLESSDSPA